MMSKVKFYSKKETTEKDIRSRNLVLVMQNKSSTKFQSITIPGLRDKDLDCWRHLVHIIPICYL